MIFFVKSIDFYGSRRLLTGKILSFYSFFITFAAFKRDCIIHGNIRKGNRKGTNQAGNQRTVGTSHGAATSIPDVSCLSGEIQEE